MIDRTASDQAGTRSEVVEAKVVADLTGPKITGPQILDVAAGRATISAHAAGGTHAMMSGSQPMPPEQIAEELEDAEELDWDAERARIALENDAKAAMAANAAEAGTDRPSLVERIKDLLDGDDPAPEAAPAES
jgi:hypothetical protein